MSWYSDAHLPRSTRTSGRIFPFDNSIFDSNAIITEDMSKALRASISSRQEKEQRVQQKILVHQMAINELHAHRIDLLEELWFMKGVVSRFRTFSIEIMQRIFECFVTSEQGLCSEIAPFLLTSICRRWRHIAVHTPTLWTKIYLHPSFKQSRLLRFLALSNPMPLDITVLLGSNHLEDSDSESGSRESVRQRERIDSIVNQLHRIRKVSIRCGSQSAVALRLLKQGPMASLQELSVEFVDDFLPDIHVDAPRLCSLTLLRGATSLLSMITPAGHLRHLKLLGPIKSNAIITFLPRCPNITEFSLEASFGDYHGNDPLASPNFITSLQRVEVSGNWRTPGADVEMSFMFLSRMIFAPRVQFLALYKLTSSPALCTYLSGVGPTLKKLVLEEMDIRKEHMSWMFASLHGLEALEVDRPPKSSTKGDLFDILTPGEGAPASSWICPKLAHLRLSFVSVKDPSTILRLLERRGPAATQELPHGIANYLENIRLRGYSPFLYSTETIETVQQRGQHIIFE